MFNTFLPQLVEGLPTWDWWKEMCFCFQTKNIKSKATFIISAKPLLTRIDCLIDGIEYFYKIKI